MTLNIMLATLSNQFCHQHQKSKSHRHDHCHQIVVIIYVCGPY